MNPTLVQKIFGHSEEVQIEAPPISANRLENAFSGLHNFVPGAEDLRKTTTALKRSGMDILQSTVLTRPLSGDSDHTILLETAPPTKAKGVDVAHSHCSSKGSTKWFQLCDLLEYKPPKPVKCQPTPAPAPPSSTVATITGHDEDDVDNEEMTMSRTGITRDQIISEFEAGVRRFHRQEIEEAFKGAESKQKAVKMLEKLHNKHDKRKNVPCIYNEIQATILKRHSMDVAPNWFADRIKSYKDYDRFQYFKSEGYRLHEEVQGVLDSCTWGEVMGVQVSDQEANNSDDQETDDEGSQVVKSKDTSIRETATMTFSLRSILREEIAYHGFLNRLENEKLRVGHGRMARLCRTVVDDTIFDIQALVPGFDFGPEAKTAVHVSPIPPDLDKLEDARVYQFEHFSNILSECVGSSVNEKMESFVFHEARKAIEDTGVVTKQDDFACNGAMNNTLREFKIATHNLWSRKRHDRDL
ncbi:hypothetical protein BJV82DRAFT_710389 [Fennellomyces sp. T-0311]|nr:hypothetical protein BJV82DRAFT_710389 [Fennellomyces sp. T-0311]